MKMDEIVARFHEAFPLASVEVYADWQQHNALAVRCSFPDGELTWSKGVRMNADDPDIDAAIVEVKAAIPLANEKFGIEIKC